jgi:hypothetical protein
MFSWVYRLVGKEAANKLGLEDKVDSKEWYKSRAIWTAIIGVILGGVQPISEAFGHPIVVPHWVFEILGGMGLYTLRTADKPIS